VEGSGWQFDLQALLEPAELDGAESLNLSIDELIVTNTIYSTNAAVEKISVIKFDPRQLGSLDAKSFMVRYHYNEGKLAQFNLDVLIHNSSDCLACKHPEMKSVRLFLQMFADEFPTFQKVLRSSGVFQLTLVHFPYFLIFFLYLTFICVLSPSLTCRHLDLSTEIS